MKGTNIKRLSANATVVLVMIIILLVQLQISYSLTFSKTADNLSGLLLDSSNAIWLAIRAGALAIVIAMWILDRRESLFKWITIATFLLTIALFFNIANLCIQVLSTITSHTPEIKFSDVFAIMVTNVLIFSIWYWIIDPPGITDKKEEDNNWDFLFPQRASDSPQFATWTPRYVDYLFVAFTTSVAFSPTETAPLTVRAKALQMLQATISLIVIVVILGNTINTLS